MTALTSQADLETSSEAYARRFAGSVGAWFLDVQARLTVELLSPWPAARVLEVGGGHGQLTGPLLAAGHDVTIAASHPTCGDRVREWVDAGRVRFETVDLLRLPYPDGAFTAALSYRLLPHMDDWRGLVRELCRVAERAVLVDYPTRRSLNVVAAPLFGLKKGVEGDTRPFTVFRDREVAAAFGAGGFRVTARRGQFVLPMAFHRGLGRAGVSRTVEAAARGVGLTRLLGSPVILRAERHE